MRHLIQFSSKTSNSTFFSYFVFFLIFFWYTNVLRIRFHKCFQFSFVSIKWAGKTKTIRRKKYTQKQTQTLRKLNAIYICFNLIYLKWVLCMYENEGMFCLDNIHKITDYSLSYGLTIIYLLLHVIKHSRFFPLACVCVHKHMVYNIHDMFRVVWICKNIAVIIFSSVICGTEKGKRATEKKCAFFSRLYIWFLSFDQWFSSC